MKRTIISLAIITFGLSLASTISISRKPLAASIRNEEQICWSEWFWKIHQDHNDLRAAIGLHPLIWSEELALAAKLRVAEMYDFETGEVIYFSHNNPTTGEKDAWNLIRITGFDYHYAGENLAKDFDDYHEMFEAWVLSPKHLANIESREYTHIGVWTFCDDENNLTVVLFGSLNK